MRLGVTEYFDSAHFLPGHKKCGQTHGHTYTVELIVEGEKKGAGMVVDFYDLKSALKKVLSEYDHRLINEIVEYPSVENISRVDLREAAGPDRPAVHDARLGRPGQMVRNGRPLTS